MLTRTWRLSDPVMELDAQYYLLVARDMLRGATLYVDIWDRKPAGLFLVYAAILRIGGDPILAYRLVAAAFAFATAVVVFVLARRSGAGHRGASIAGIVYLLWSAILGGIGGQSPVFYNFLVAASVLLALTAHRDAANGQRGRIVALGAIACLLAGSAIQIKTTAGFEAVFVGLAFVVALRRSGAHAPLLLAAALLWLAAGILPTAAIAGWYAARGLFGAYWFANVVSITLRPGYPIGTLAERLAIILLILSPLIAAVGATWRIARGGAAPHPPLLLWCWLGAAILGFLAIGTFFDHYALPLVAPLAVLAAPAFGRVARIGALTLALGSVLIALSLLRANDDGARAREVASIVQRNSEGRGCPYVFTGDPVTYLLAHACVPTRYAFPFFLSNPSEEGAIGVAAPHEVARILARRPPVIVDWTRRRTLIAGSGRAVRDALSRDYRVIARARREGWETLVYLRDDLPLRR